MRNFGKRAGNWLRSRFSRITNRDLIVEGLMKLDEALVVLTTVNDNVVELKDLAIKVRDEVQKLINDAVNQNLSQAFVDKLIALQENTTTLRDHINTVDGLNPDTTLPPQTPGIPINTKV